MFSPGETIVHNFVIPFAKQDLSKIIISYKQNGSVILERIVTSADQSAFIDLDDMAKTEIQIMLSQEESLLFAEDSNFTIQLNVLSNGGSRNATCEFKGSSGVQHHSEVISNG